MQIYGNRIFTKRLQLRKPEVEDLKLLVEWSHNLAACGDYLTPENYDLEQLRYQMLSGTLWNDKERVFIVELRESLKPIGTIHYWHLNGQRQTIMISLKIALLEERRKGYGTELQKYLIIQLFQNQEVEQIEMYTDINNLAQQRCLRKLGFELVQSLSYDDQNVRRTGHLFRLTAERFQHEPIYKYYYE